MHTSSVSCRPYVFMRCWVRISAGALALPTVVYAIFAEFPPDKYGHSISIKSRLLPSESFDIHLSSYGCTLIIHILKTSLCWSQKGPYHLGYKRCIRELQRIRCQMIENYIIIAIVTLNHTQNNALLLLSRRLAN